MPCAMMHLQCAKHFNANADIAFYIGNLAPDALDIREIKDKTHLRIYTDGREAMLIRYAKSLDTRDSYQLGTLLHLYADMFWDRGPMKRHQDEYKGDNWFRDYRNQNRMICSHMFNAKPWAKPLWEKMTQADEKLYSSVDLFSPSDIKSYLLRNYDWHCNSDLGPATDFTVKTIEDFCRNTAENFKKWIINNNIDI